MEQRRRSLLLSKGHPLFTPRYQPPIGNHTHLNSSGDSTGGSSTDSGLLEPPHCNTSSSSFSSSCSSIDDCATESCDLPPSPPPDFPSPYLSLLSNMDQDPKWLEERGRGKAIGMYLMKGEIGIGNFARVRLGVHQLLKERVAVKIIEKSKPREQDGNNKLEKMMVREVATLDKLQHPNILRLYEVIETPWKLYLISEWAAAGDLYAKVTLKGRLSEREGRHVFSQILSAVTFLHGLNIVHRDLKAENIFFSTASHCKVGDFGFATMISNKDQLLSTFCGSPPYAAPELFLDEHYQGPPVDIWALGILLYFMLEGTLPFVASTIPGLKALILSGTYTLSPSTSTEAASILSSILQQRPSQRLALSGILRHSWMSKHVRRQDTTALLLPAMKNRAHSTSIPNKQQLRAGVLSSQEYQALGMFRRLGIPIDEIERAREEGVRSRVGGIYRIVLHKLQQGQQIHENVFDCGTKEVREFKDKHHSMTRSSSYNRNSWDKDDNDGAIIPNHYEGPEGLSVPGGGGTGNKGTVLLKKQIAYEVPQSTTCEIL